MEESVKPRFRLAEAGPLTLAYMGDAVFELLTRERIVLAGEKPPAELNRLARGYVTAVAQSAAVERLLPLLDEDETAVYKRGRNAKSAHAPKSAGAVEYRRATGLECLFGYLYLAGRIERARALFEAVCAPEPVIPRDAGKDG